jgi:hypothetical protein
LTKSGTSFRMYYRVNLYKKQLNKKHQPIILDRDFQVQGKVIATIPS